MKKIYASGLSVLASVALFAIGGLMACSDDDSGPTNPEPPVELKDQIQYEETISDIRSVIYKGNTTDGYTFYFSPTANIVDIAGMTQANDALRIEVQNPKGTIDIAADAFTIRYKDISVQSQTMNDVETCKLSIDLTTPTHVNLYLEVVLKTGKKLYVRYNSTCAETAPEALNNQYDLDGAISPIGSVLAWRDESAGRTVYYIYAQSDVMIPSKDTPADLEISIADGVSDRIDLSKVDPTQVSIACGEFKNDASTTGTLRASKDKFGQTLTVSLDATTASQRLRAEWEGADFVRGYVSTDRFAVTSGGKTFEADLGILFRKNDSGTSSFVFGDAKTAGGGQPTAPTDLTAGKYAVQIKVAPADLDKKIDLSSGQVNVLLYDYENHATFDFSLIGGTGYVQTDVVGDKVYLRLEAAFTDGPAVKCEWFGKAVLVTEGFDLTPVIPFEPMIRIVDSKGLVQKEVPVTEMVVRRDKNYTVRGGADSGGATFDAYIFSFKNEFTTEGTDIEADYTLTPTLMLPADQVNKDLDLTQAPEGMEWEIKYQTRELQGAPNWGNNYTAYGMTSYRTPNEVTVLTRQDPETKEWTVKIRLLDYGSMGSAWGDTPPYEKGSENVLTIEWAGKATKYSGSKTNDLTDADY